MSNLTKIADKMNGKADRFSKFIRSMSASERVTLADQITAASEQMTPQERKMLIEALSPLVAADAKRNSKKSRRLTRMSAAQADPLMKPTVVLAAAELTRLGFEINAFAVDGSVVALDKAMSEQKWPTERRIRLKTGLYKLGCLDA